MDKSTRSFLKFTCSLAAVFLSAAAVLIYIYRYSSLETYNIIFLTLLLLVALVAAIVITSAAIALYIYRKKRVGRFFYRPARAFLKVLLSLLLSVSGLIKGGQDGLRRFYIDINNIMVDSEHKRYPPEVILLLLPHCLQNADCCYKVTNDISNCRECGKCCIGAILELSREFGVKAVVVTGGTAARNAVARLRPKIVLSVACERDLALGISDVRVIPVLGVLNERPEGPCHNTRVDTQKLREKLGGIISG